jgi:VWFA-related protein
MREVCCVIALLLAASDATAQAPIFRTSTRLVQVNIVVQDSHGQPVGDLTREDFAIDERGKPQQIQFFSRTSADAPAAPSATLPPHVFSNVFATHPDAPTSITVVLLDLLNTSWTDQRRARKALVTFLEQIRPHDRLAIFALGAHGLTLLHDYTTDSASLVAHLKKVNGETPSKLDASRQRSEDQVELRTLNLDLLFDAGRREAEFVTADRVLNTLSTFRTIAQHLSGLPGRKNLIWLSGGFPITIGFDTVPAIGSTRDRRTFTWEMDAAVRALNNSGVAVYPVDARGLMGLTRLDASVRGAPSARHPSAAASQPVFDDNIDSMSELAERTGGRATYLTNDLNRAIRRAIDDTRVTYTLGYYSTDERQDGKFREITVKVNRPHLDVRYRKGYFALKPSDNTVMTRDDEVRAAVWSPLESTAVPVNARADFVEQPEPNTVSVSAQIDPAAVGFRKDGDRWKAELDIVYVQKDDQGHVQGDSIGGVLSLALSDSSYAKLLKEGLIVERRFPRAPQAITLRIVVRDVASSSIGSLTIPFSQITEPPAPR